MTAHLHSTFMEGCFRCDLSREEAAAWDELKDGCIDDSDICEDCPEQHRGPCDICHCGKPPHVHDDGFTRGLCRDCDAVRCDAYPGACA